MGLHGIFRTLLLLLAACSPSILAQPAIITISASAPNSTEGSPASDSEPPLMFHLNRDGNINRLLIVNLSISGTASNRLDYMPLPTKITFPPGVTLQTITNAWLEDTLLEQTETLEVAITAGLNYLPGPASNVAVRLLDNDHTNYAKISGRVFDTFVDSLGSTRKLMLDIYTPRQTTAPAPLVVWIFGGAWRGGDRQSVPTPVLELLTNGYAVASIDYRLSGISKWPSQIQDVRTAVRWLRSNAPRYGIDGNRIALWGASSGGHLALLGASSPGRREFIVNDATVSLAGGKYLNVPDSVQAVVAWFPPTDFLQMDHFTSDFNHNSPTSPESALIGTGIQINPALASTANPILYVDSNTPPTLIMHGTADRLVPHNQSELLYAQLRKAQSPAIFWPQINLGHGGAGWADPARTAAIHAFLDRALKNDSSNLPPSPSFRIGATNSAPNKPIGFDATASVDRDGSVLAYYWSFGDGAGSTNQIATHTYSRAGIYYITLCVLDDRQAIVSTGSWVTISNTPPSAGTPPKIGLIPPLTSLKNKNAFYVQAEVFPGDSAISVVQFFQNGIFAGQDFTPPYGAAIPSITGRNVITAKAIDAAGRAANSPPLQIAPN